MTRARVSLIALSAGAALASSALAQVAPAPAQQRPAPLFIEQAPPQVATLYATGQQILTQWEQDWRPMCGSELTHFGLNELIASAKSHELEFASGAPIRVVDFGRHEGGQGEQDPAGGLDIVFILAASVPPAAVPAFAFVESYLEAIFVDPVTVTINVSFAVLGDGVLGSASSFRAGASWTNSRAGLVNGMDAGDVIQTYLPTGSTIPVRYNGNSSTVTREDRVFWTRACYNTTIGYVAGDAANMQFNSNFNWDYNPAGGVTGYSFQDVVAHEVGHTLGFSSGADYRTNDMDGLDIFRFQRTDGLSDFNPDTYGEFQVCPRTVDFNTPNDNANSDTITSEYRMSDGNPYQCSHFREQTANIGLMDPALGAGKSNWPYFYKPSDLEMFDAIGWSPVN